MKRYTFTGSVSVPVTITVEADSIKAARETAEEEGQNGIFDLCLSEWSNLKIDRG